MGAIAQSIAWWCFVPGHLTPPAFVRAVAEAGYNAIDLVPPEYFGLVKEYGLAISAAQGHASIVNGLNRRAQHDCIERELRANLALAEQWEIPNVLCFSGNRAGLEALMPSLPGLMQTEDMAEAVRAFTERRQAVFKGR